MRITQPLKRPDVGITFPVVKLVTLPSSLSVLVDRDRHVNVELLDCFPSQLHDDGIYTLSQIQVIESVVTQPGVEISVTIPAPTSSGPNGWLRNLQSNAPKPAWVHVDRLDSMLRTSLWHSTLNQILLQCGRSATPPYPQRVATPPRLPPASTPQPGLTLPCQPVRSEGNDTWRIVTHGGNELVIWLTDCFSKSDANYDLAWDLMAQHRSTLAVTIPRPFRHNDWIGGLTQGSQHAGWIWLDDTTTLNQWLVDNGHADSMPF